MSRVDPFPDGAALAAWGEDQDRSRRLRVARALGLEAFAKVGAGYKAFQERVMQRLMERGPAFAKIMQEIDARQTGRKKAT